MFKNPLIVAHRGASHAAAENTLAAFRLAWDQGADAIETDLRLTADGEIVALHDENLRRTANDPRPLRELSFAALRAVAPHVPTLAEALATVPRGKQIVLELKEAFVAPLVAALASAPRDRITLIAFDATLIAEAKAALPDCRALWLNGDTNLRTVRHGEWLAARVRELGLDGVDLRYRRSLNPALLAALRADRRTILTYTVNHARTVRDCRLLELEGITTDRPADARRWWGEVCHRGAD